MSAGIVFATEEPRPFSSAPRDGRRFLAWNAETEVWVIMHWGFCHSRRAWGFQTKSSSLRAGEASECYSAWLPLVEGRSIKSFARSREMTNKLNMESVPEAVARGLAELDEAKKEAYAKIMTLAHVGRMALLDCRAANTGRLHDEALAELEEQKAGRARKNSTPNQTDRQSPPAPEVSEARARMTEHAPGGESLSDVDGRATEGEGAHNPTSPSEGVGMEARLAAIDAKLTDVLALLVFGMRGTDGKDGKDGIDAMGEIEAVDAVDADEIGGRR